MFASALLLEIFSKLTPTSSNQCTDRNLLESRISYSPTPVVAEEASWCYNLNVPPGSKITFSALVFVGHKDQRVTSSADTFMLNEANSRRHHAHPIIDP